MALKIKCVAFRNAPPDLYAKGVAEILAICPEHVLVEADQDPDVIVFLTGGSEQEALELLRPGKTYLLIASDKANAWAAATEVKAWASHHQIASQLLNLNQPDARYVISLFAQVRTALHTLKGKKAALIGNVSHWLVASHFSLPLAYERFGINIEHLPWHDLPHYLDHVPDSSFLTAFQEHQADLLQNEARIYGWLRSIIKKGAYQALTLECFEMVNHHHVTACLALALLNSQGIVAGCEGDLVSLVGLMLAQAIGGKASWMANLAFVNPENILFAHCTAPLSMLRSFSLQSHFETGKSASIKGLFDTEEVTVFRLSQGLDKAFLAPGRIVHQPAHMQACRTQAEIRLDVTCIEKLLHNPLGNHHILMPGNHYEAMRMALWQCSIPLV